MFYKPLCARPCAGCDRAVVKHSFEKGGEREETWGSRGSRSGKEAGERKVQLSPYPCSERRRRAEAKRGRGEGTETSYWLPARGICPQLIFFCPVTAK